MAWVQGDQWLAAAAAHQQDQAFVAEREIGEAMRVGADLRLRTYLAQQMAHQQHFADQLALVAILQLGSERARQVGPNGHQDGHGGGAIGQRKPCRERCRQAQ